MRREQRLSLTFHVLRSRFTFSPNVSSFNVSRLHVSLSRFTSSRFTSSRFSLHFKHQLQRPPGRGSSSGKTAALLQRRVAVQGRGDAPDSIRRTERGSRGGRRRVTMLCSLRIMSMNGRLLSFSAGPRRVMRPPRRHEANAPGACGNATRRASSRPRAPVASRRRVGTSRHRGSASIRPELQGHESR